MEEIRNKLWAVGGGKGGVGKSVVTLMLGSSLARLGHRVILVDADLGGSNLHTLVGIRYPKNTLADFINRKVDTIDEVIMETTVKNMSLICGADDILGIANPKYVQKARLFTHLKRLDADVILLDLGAGTSFTTIDFFLYAPNRIVVLTPEITSVQNSYGFIKSSLYRGLNEIFSKEPEVLELIKRASISSQGENIDSIAKLHAALRPFGLQHQESLMRCIKSMNIKLILNMVREAKETNVTNIVKSVAKNYLDLDVEDIGYITYDSLLKASINRMESYLSGKKDSVARGNTYDIAYSIAKKCRIGNPVSPLFPVASTSAR